MDQLCHDTLSLVNSVMTFFFPDELSQALGTKESALSKESTLSNLPFAFKMDLFLNFSFQFLFSLLSPREFYHQLKIRLPVL